jgi:hypothetical protein
VYDIGLVRKLCECIATERDEEKARDLLDLLHAITKENDEEIALRLAFLKKKYAIALRASAGLN